MSLENFKNQILIFFWFWGLGACTKWVPSAFWPWLFCFFANIWTKQHKSRPETSILPCDLFPCAVLLESNANPGQRLRFCLVTCFLVKYCFILGVCSKIYKQMLCNLFPCAVLLESNANLGQRLRFCLVTCFLVKQCSILAGSSKISKQMLCNLF